MNRLAQVNIGQTFGSRFGVTLGLADLVSIILRNAIAIAAVVLFIFIVFGGISLIAGAGSNNSEQVGRGKKAITTAIVGFLIIFGTYWLIQIIQMVFGLNILTP